MPYEELKEIAWECNRELFRQRLAIHTFGNASAIDRGKGVFAIKPSGVPYDRLRPEEMVVVDLENRVVEGTLRFSSDTRTHAVLYRHFSEIGGVAHTHSPYAVAWAQAMKPVPILGTMHADHLPAEVPCTMVMSDERIKGNYEEETGNLIVETFRNLSYREVPMVLVAGHGPFTWGETAEAAVFPQRDSGGTGQNCPVHPADQPGFGAAESGADRQTFSAQTRKGGHLRAEPLRGRSPGKKG